MFVKDYIDIDSYDTPLFIEATTTGVLLEEATGKIYLNELKLTLENVESTMYAPLKKNL